MAIYNPYYQSPSYNGTGTYPLSYQNIPQTPQSIQQSPQNIITGVQGLDAAKAYPLGPNTRGYLFDTEKDFLYIKETDQTGFPRGNVRILKCKEITEEELREPSFQNTIPDNIVTADKLESFIQNYLDTHSYRPYIPRSERNKNE